MIISPGPPRDGGEPPARRSGHGEQSQGVQGVRALVRAQLRAALGTCAIVLAVVVVLPLLPVLAPDLGWTRPYGIPLLWMGLAFATQPLWIVLACWHLRRAERIERAFLASRTDSGPGARPGGGTDAEPGTAAVAGAAARAGRPGKEPS